MNWRNTIATIIAIGPFVVGPHAKAGEPPTVESKSRTIDLNRHWSVGGEARTIYTQPNATGGTTQQGNERGSSSNTSYGATIQYHFK